MNIAINPEHGGNDTGKTQDGLYEKNVILELSRLIYDKLKNDNDVYLIRTKDESISNDDRIKQFINKYPDKTNTILLSLSLGEEEQFNIIYPLSKTDKIVSNIANNLSKIKKTDYYQMRYPTNPKQDYYYITRNTPGYETIVIKLGNNLSFIKNNINEIATLISKQFITEKNINTYTVKQGDTLYSIAKKYNITVNELKEINNLKSNLITINQILKIPTQKIHIIKSGDTLYSLSKKYNTTVDKIKEINNLKSNLLTIGNVLIIP